MTMENFAAIDFETANGRRSSVCAVGVVIVRGGVVVDKFYSLIQPAPNFYTCWTTNVHGLTRRDTDGQPIFPEVWKRIEEKIEGLPLVAHNRPFDEGCLKAVFEEYAMEYPGYKFYCTPRRGALCACLAISFMLWRRHAATILPITTMPLPTPRPAPP